MYQLSGHVYERMWTLWMSPITSTSKKSALGMSWSIQVNCSEIQLKSLCPNLGNPWSNAVWLGQQVAVPGPFLVHFSGLHIGNKGNNNFGGESGMFNQGHWWFLRRTGTFILTPPFDFNIHHSQIAKERHIRFLRLRTFQVLEAC